ncbi:hypothetical protein I3843_08G039600 [Carya illinoinensis]|uniref:Uncharacterized protein n=1 Tax=Carya illinoinensis TaxID=32201 RepID=A0A922EAW9_CARIL|nr:hypothetical protein I3842_08G040000 [Carya illinoinensis]KAG7966221.1 hypothetical protein I3843_08G039600 [Carya illinoinensis]
MSRRINIWSQLRASDLLVLTLFDLREKYRYVPLVLEVGRRRAGRLGRKWISSATRTRRRWRSDGGAGGNEGKLNGSWRFSTSERGPRAGAVFCSFF